MAEVACPRDEGDVVDAIADALRSGDRLTIAGGGSKAGIGRTPIGGRTLAMTGLAGVVDYDPAELVLTVRPGMPLAAVEALVAGERQMLAFDPFDHGPVFGRAAGAATVGGIVAAGVAGSRRLSAGGARDHILGVRAVSGRGELFVAGAKVVKNVTGYDLPKLMAGSWGRLCALTELTLKVLPRPETTATRVLAGLDPARAIGAMAAAMGSQAEAACAAHRPATARSGAITAIRIEGFAPSVRARGEMLDRVLADHGIVERPSDAEAAAFWTDLKTLAPLAPDDRTLWRINVAPGAGAAVAQALAGSTTDWLMDWAGGLLWLASDAAASAVRGAAADAGGHAMLVRAGGDGGRVPVFHPAAPGVAALEERVRRAFDPGGLFETARF